MPVTLGSNVLIGRVQEECPKSLLPPLLEDLIFEKFFQLTWMHLVEGLRLKEILIIHILACYYRTGKSIELVDLVFNLVI